MPPRKRKASARSEDEGHKSPRKCAKSTSETPPKRTPTSRKRKANPRYEEEKSEEEEDSTVKRAKSTKATPTKRKPAPRAVKVKRDDPDWLVTNEKSSLAYEDLHTELSDPRTYEGFTREDWEDLRSTLPESVPLNPDGYSISWDFLKYDADFRRGIREFQEDLSAGRLDPKWQAAAAEAMEERARGDFDAYKENNYEEFWGQKQKLAYDVLAGESTSLKLETMIENGMFRVGDEFVLTRAIGRKEKRVLIEKEMKIIAVGNQTLTFAIPPGQLKYPRPVAALQGSADEKRDEGEPLADEAPMTASMDNTMDEGKAAVDHKSHGNTHQSGAQEHQRLGADGPLAEESQPLSRVLHTKPEEHEAVGMDKTDGNGHPTGAQEHEKSSGVRPLAKIGNGHPTAAQEYGKPGEDEALAEGSQPLNGTLDTRLDEHELLGKDKTDGDGPRIGVQNPHTLDEAVPLVDNVQRVHSVEDTTMDIDEVLVEMKSHHNDPTSDTQLSDTADGNLASGGLTGLSNGDTDDNTPSAITNSTTNGLQMPELEPLEPPEAVIHYEITNLRHLMNKAIEIDGRLDPKDIKSVPAASPWKFMRVKRNNQDLGTLFEMRDEFYTYKLPKLAKRTKE